MVAVESCSFGVAVNNCGASVLSSVIGGIRCGTSSVASAIGAADSSVTLKRIGCVALGDVDTTSAELSEELDRRRREDGGL